MNQTPQIDLGDKARKNIHKSELRRKYGNEIGTFTIAIDLVSGVMVGVVVGLMLDKLFNSRPVFLLVCIFIGMLASAKIIWQKYKR